MCNQKLDKECICSFVLFCTYLSSCTQDGPCSAKGHHSYVHEKVGGVILLDDVSWLYACAEPLLAGYKR